MKKALLIYNPLAGDRSVPRKLDFIIGDFHNSGILLQPYRFKNSYEKELLKVLEEGNYDSLVVSGGDGTINSIVNILLKNNLQIPIGIIPSGTCNDLAHSLDLPTSLKDCIDVILGGNVRSIDTGLLNDEQYFLSTCAGGSFVDVSYNTNQDLKKNFGPFAYYLKAITEMANIKPFDLKLTTDEGIIEESVLLFLIINGTQGGGFTNLMRQADISDGIMDIVLIKNCLHLDLAALFFKVLSRDLTTDKNITKLTAKKCVIESDRSIPTSIDGEKGGELPIEVRFVKKALKIFVDKTSDI
jgi:YegS/Rv2252/BmrU family lipid kinase